MQRMVVVPRRPEGRRCRDVKLFLGKLGRPLEEPDLTRDHAAREELNGEYGSNFTPMLLIGDEGMIGLDPALRNEILGE